MVSTDYGSQNTSTSLSLEDDVNSSHHPIYFHPNDHLRLLAIKKISMVQKTMRLGKDQCYLP